MCQRSKPDDGPSRGKTKGDGDSTCDWSAAVFTRTPVTRREHHAIARSRATRNSAVAVGSRGARSAPAKQLFLPGTEGSRARRWIGSWLHARGVASDWDFVWTHSCPAVVEAGSESVA